MDILNKIRGVIDFILRWFCIIIFVCLVALIVFQVVVRSFGGGNAWTESMARIIFIWQGIIGAAYVIGENDDVAIDFFVRKFPAAVAKGIQILAHAIVAGFAIWVMVIGGMILCTSSFDQTIELLPFSQGQVYLIIPISGILVAIYSLLHIVTTIATPITIVDEDNIDISTLQEEGI